MGLLSRLLGHASDLTPEQTREELDGILLPEEPVEVAFKVIRDLFVFTDRRLILVDKQGLRAGRSITSWCLTEPSPPIDMRDGWQMDINSEPRWVTCSTLAAISNGLLVSSATIRRISCLADGVVHDLRPKTALPQMANLLPGVLLLASFQR